MQKPKRFANLFHIDGEKVAETENKLPKRNNMNKRQTKKKNKKTAAQLALAASILGAVGGAVKSDRKTAASRENGKKGGRPRKDAGNE